MIRRFMHRRCSTLHSLIHASPLFDDESMIRLAQRRAN